MSKNKKKNSLGENPGSHWLKTWKNAPTKNYGQDLTVVPCHDTITVWNLIQSFLVTTDDWEYWNNPSLSNHKKTSTQATSMHKNITIRNYHVFYRTI